jgi:DNA-binding LytR/AlgR family response regulator
MEPEISIPIRERGFTWYVHPSEIEYVMADRAVCHFFYTDGHKQTVSGCLADFEAELLHSDLFCRVHRSFLVNISKIRSYDTHRYIGMRSSMRIPISKEGKKALLDTGFRL